MQQYFSKAKPYKRDREREKDRHTERKTGTSNGATVFYHSMQPQNWDLIS